MLTTKKKAGIIEKFRGHAADPGSVEIQTAILSEEIQRLAGHLKKNPKDNHSRKGLLGMVAKRKKLLDYLRREDSRRYNSLIKKIELKK
jgi:small subunit ribosomal protein S15